MDELIYKLMGDLMDALNSKGNATTEAEFNVARAIQTAIRERRIILKEAARG